MDPIEGASKVLKLLRRRMPSAQTMHREGGPAAADDAAAASSAAGTARTAHDEVVTRLRNLNPDDSDYAERAAECFVEGVLLAEFGADMTNDPRFRQIIRSVASEMRSDGELAIELDDLYRSLRQA